MIKLELRDIRNDSDIRKFLMKAKEQYWFPFTIRTEDKALTIVKSTADLNVFLNTLTLLANNHDFKYLFCRSTLMADFMLYCFEEVEFSFDGLMALSRYQIWELCRQRNYELFTTIKSKEELVTTLIKWKPRADAFNKEVELEEETIAAEKVKTAAKKKKKRKRRKR